MSESMAGVAAPRTAAALTPDVARGAAPPPALLMEISAGWTLARALHVTADLGVADALDEAPRPAAALAAAVGAHPGALERVLRHLGAHGVFAVAPDGLVAHTPASRLLRTDHPQSLRAFVRTMGLPFSRGASEHFGHAVRTGRPGVEVFAPAGAFPYLAEHADEARVFDAAMAGKAHAQVAGVLAAYDFSGLGVVGDIGGGRGHLVRAILERTPGARGVLFDQPHVIAEVAGLESDRLSLAAGDFFRDPLPACDAYVLMEVIHDWADAEAAAILRAVRAAAPPHARLLLVEDLIPDDPGPSWARTVDMLMLAVTGGLQRSAREYAALFAETGFRLTRVVGTPTGVSIVEAAAA